MKAIIYAWEDNNLYNLPANRVSITQVSADLSLEKILEHAKQITPDKYPFWIIEAAQIPIDRTYRDAWELDGSEGEPHGYGELKND